MQLDAKALAVATADIVREHVAAATAPLLERIAALEARQPEKGEKGEQGEPGEPGPRGEAGADAYPGRACGLFDEAAEYRARDVVALNGSAFMARYDEPGECPGEGWMLLSQKGKRGERGPSFSGGYFDKDTLELVLQRDDGEEVTIACGALIEAARNG